MVTHGSLGAKILRISHFGGSIEEVRDLTERKVSRTIISVKSGED